MNIKKEVYAGTKWTTLSTIVLSITAILKISILTRYLEKSEFGLMALVTFVMGFMTLFNDMGLKVAILHKQEITKEEYASLYWFNMLISILMFVLLLLVTPLVSSFYSQPLLKSLIPLIGVNLIISGIGSHFRFIEMKHLKFKAISVIDIISTVIAFGVAICLAVYDFGVYSLVYSLIVQFLISNISLLIIGIKKYGLKLRYKFNETKPFLGIGLYQVGAQTLNYFNRDLDILIIGKFFSADILGGYSLARELVRRPIGFILPIVNKVGAPTLSKFNKDTIGLKKYYLKMTNLLASFVIPMYLVIALFSYPLVYILYGKEFLGITFIVQILCVNMIFRVVGGNVGNLIIASGRTDLDLKWNALTLLIIPIFVLIGAYFNIEIVAIMITLSSIALFIPSYYYLIKRIINATLKEYVYAFFKVDVKQFLKL
ncbi:MOP flippase family protein [Croceibacter atlanticus]|uniref:MOP flippase family protein n=1 Tax=Croceibacter atlanticus TaxID=313588 RepID=UPI0024B906C4|nr:MOP flippase family protein [Croceibacter atlanticus]